MVLTDASHMVGMTCRMKRRDLMPAAIAAGVDMFLFFNDMDKDFDAMKQSKIILESFGSSRYTKPYLGATP